MNFKKWIERINVIRFGIWNMESGMLGSVMLFGNHVLSRTLVSTLHFRYPTGGFSYLCKGAWRDPEDKGVVCAVFHLCRKSRPALTTQCSAEAPLFHILSFLWFQMDHTVTPTFGSKSSSSKWNWVKNHHRWKFTVVVILKARPNSCQQKHAHQITSIWTSHQNMLSNLTCRTTKNTNIIDLNSPLKESKLCRDAILASSP